MAIEYHPAMRTQDLVRETVALNAEVQLRRVPCKAKETVGENALAQTGPVSHQARSSHGALGAAGDMGRRQSDIWPTVSRRRAPQQRQHVTAPREDRHDPRP